MALSFSGAVIPGMYSISPACCLKEAVQSESESSLAAFLAAIVACYVENETCGFELYRDEETAV